MPLNGETWRIQKLEDISERHDRDLYRGNGLPGLTTRMANVEKAMRDMQEFLEEMKTRRDTKMNLILGGVITVIAGLVLAKLKVI